jgi:hypothetical protein
MVENLGLVGEESFGAIGANGKWQRRRGGFAGGRGQPGKSTAEDSGDGPRACRLQYRSDRFRVAVENGTGSGAALEFDSIDGRSREGPGDSPANLVWARAAPKQQVQP